jgi:hypothetical protein
MITVRVRDENGFGLVLAEILHFLRRSGIFRNKGVNQQSGTTRRANLERCVTNKCNGDLPVGGRRLRGCYTCKQYAGDNR